ncbi:MAG: hypothetical protein WCQ72_06895 [Eubacteriales bacterium]
MKKKNAAATETPARRDKDYTKLVVDRHYCDTLADSVVTVTSENGVRSCMSAHLCGEGECGEKPQVLN